MKALIPFAIILSCGAAIGLAFKQEASATPRSDVELISPSQAEGCACGCVEGGTCTCRTCPVHPAVTPETEMVNALSALTKQLAESQAATDARIAALETKLSAPPPDDEDAELIAALTARLDMLEVADELSLFSEPIVPTPVEPEADAQPTPYEVIFKAIDLLDLKNTETLVDFGCGPDARVLTHAFHDAGCRGVGVELDPDRAAAARNLISTAGLEDWIKIVEGDATTTSVQGNVGFVYLWPETLEELRPKLQELDRFVSYAHAVPGLTMQRIDVPGHEPLWYWERSPEVSYSERPYAIYNGRRYYSDYNPGCNCSMCRTIREQLASREHVEQVPTQTRPAQSAPQTTTVGASTPTYSASASTSQRSSYCSSCANGQCGRPMRFFRRR